MRKYTCIFNLILLPVLCALLASAAALPTSISLLKPHILQAANATQTSTGLVPLGTRLPFYYQDLILVFTKFGEAIPQIEISNTFGGADGIVQEYLDTQPQQGIPENRFEYRLPQGDVLLAIGGPVGEEITWRQLYRVLQALQRFMVVLKPPHYQELNFEIHITNKRGILGSGIIWYFPSDSKEVQKRTTRTLIPDGSLLSFNESSNLTLALGDDDVLYPIQGTSIILDFYYIGLALPDAIVTANLENAIKWVREYSPGPHENDTIRHNHFQYRTTGPFSRVATTVFASNGHQISWLELYNVLDGLRQFVIGKDQASTHFQTLGYRILDDIKGKIGVGTLSYYDPSLHGVERRAMADEVNYLGSALTQTAKPTNQSFLSVIKDSIPVPIPWPIPNTDLTLTFTVYGDGIPLIELLTLLGAAQLGIAPNVHRAPTEPIGSFRYQNRPGTLVINFVTYDGQNITWLELQQILVGLSLYCAAGHNQALVFEIDAAGQGRIGFGTIASAPLQKLIQRRASGRDYLSTTNSTSLSPENASAIQRGDPRYPIPGTPITLDIAFIGSTAIPPIDLSATLTSALQEIEPHVMREGAQAIPGSQWVYGSKMTNVWFSVLFFHGRKLTWQQLNWIIIGLLHWMTGEGLSDCKSLAFDIEIIGQELVGMGSVFYDSSLVTSVVMNMSTTGIDRRSALVEEMSLGPANKVTLSPSPAITLDSVLGHNITWFELDETLRGLGCFMARQITQTQYRQSLVSKVDIDLAEWSTVQGLLGYTTYLPQILAARSVLPSAGTNLTVPIPYPIPNTDITLRIILFTKTIPASRIADLFNNALRLLTPNVTDHPDEYFDKDVFFFEVKYLDGRELVTIEVYPRVGEHLTWLQLFQTLNGLQLFMNGAEGRPFRRSVSFNVDIDGAYIAYGLLSYFFPTPRSTLRARSLPAPNATLTDPIPYPLIGTPITLAFTSLLPTPIPTERVRDFFELACERVGEEIEWRGATALIPLIWNHRKMLAPGLTMSFTIHRMIMKHITWENLAEILDGVVDFMEGKWRPRPSMQALAFNVEIVEKGVVATGALSYVARSSGLGEAFGNSSISSPTNQS